MIAGQSVGLAQQIERAQQKNEAKLAEQINAPKLDIGTEEISCLRRFGQWCSGRGVRDLPAKPATIAMWIRYEAEAGLALESIMAGLTAIEFAHAGLNLANPVACPAPRAELEKLIGTQGPRSWKLSERLLFAGLPPEVRAVISRRAKQDELALRSLQNSVAALRKTATNKEGLNNHA